MIPQKVLYVSDEAQGIKIESGRRGDSLFIQIKPAREISTEEAVSQAPEGPIWKIIAALDQVLPKINAAYDGEGGYVIVHPPRQHVPLFTVEIKNFFDFPVDTERMKGQCVNALKKISL